jgi:hypothetical protein
MPRYLTGLVTTDYWRFPPFPYSTRHWRLCLIRTARSQMSGELSRGTDGRTRRRHGKEVAIEAQDEAAAQRAAFILDAAAQAWDGPAFLSWFGGRIELTKVTKRDRGRTKPEIERRASRSNQGIPLSHHLIGPYKQTISVDREPWFPGSTCRGLKVLLISLSKTLNPAATALPGSREPVTSPRIDG